MWEESETKIVNKLKDKDEITVEECLGKEQETRPKVENDSSV